MSMLVVCCFIALLYPVACITRYRIYNKTDVSTENGEISEMEAASKLDCAAICLESGSCKSYQFNKTTNKCRMSTVSLAAPDDRGAVYSTVAGDFSDTTIETATESTQDVTTTSTNNCPTHQGYSIWTYEDMQLCLKYYSSEMKHTVATSTCETDGAHLVLIDSPAVRMRIDETLSALGVTVPVWLDGYDATGITNQFLNWKGEPLTWIEWGGNNPDDVGGDDCMIGEYNDGYKYRDRRCSIATTVLCQIDIM